MIMLIRLPRLFKRINLSKTRSVSVAVCASVFWLSLFTPSLHATKTILFLGDSLTEGYGVREEESYPSLVRESLKKKKHDVKVINGGISSSTSASGPSRLRWFLRAKPAILILALGANDGLRGLPVEKMKKNLARTIELAKTNNMIVILAGMQVPPNYGPTYTKAFRRVFRDLVKKYRIREIPFLLKGVGGEKRYNQADGIHPNAEGYKIVAKTVLEYLEPLL